MTSRRARRFRAIFMQNFLKINTFFIKYWYFSELSCDKKNLKWIFISYGIYETRCVFYIPSPKARGHKTHNSFHKYRMKWKFISDPIYIYDTFLEYFDVTQGTVTHWRFTSKLRFWTAIWYLGHNYLCFDCQVILH